MRKRPLTCTEVKYSTESYALTYGPCPLMARQVLKVAVVGEEGTGKSCIIARYVEGRFLRTTKPTTGADFSATHVTVNEQDYLYQIWDVSGKWRALPSLGSEFWTDMSGCILVYDVTNAASFQFLDALRGKVYQESSREDIPLILVGNKADLEPQGTEVPTKQALAWCEDKSIPFFETSARSGAGLHTVFQLLAEQAVEFYNKRHIDVQISQGGHVHRLQDHPLLRKVSKVFTLGKRVSRTPKLKSNKQNREYGHDAVPQELAQASPEESHDKSSALEERNATLQRQLEEERRRSQELLQKMEEQKKDALEKTHLLECHETQLKAMHDELEQKTQAVEELTQRLKEVTAHCRALEGSTQTLHDQVKSHSIEYQPQQQLQLHPTSFWEVGRQEVELNMHRMVGTGAWGYVVEGTFRGKTVAVKCLHSVIRQPHFLQTIRREIDMMARVRHPNLVLFIAVVLDNETGPMIITELLDTSLRHAYEQNQLHKSSVLSILVDVALALNYLHLMGDGIIHRDVSSANVLLEAKPNHQWKAKLSDFGSANLIRESSTVGPGAIVYSAPEVRRECSIPQSPKVDVFSYGVLMCEVLLRRFPSSEHFQQMLEEVRRWPLLHSVAHGCTRESPEDRPTMSAVIGTLNQMSSTQ